MKVFKSFSIIGCAFILCFLISFIGCSSTTQGEPPTSSNQKPVKDCCSSVTNSVDDIYKNQESVLEEFSNGVTEIKYCIVPYQSIIWNNLPYSFRATGTISLYLLSHNDNDDSYYKYGFINLMAIFDYIMINIDPAFIAKRWEGGPPMPAEIVLTTKRENAFPPLGFEDGIIAEFAVKGDFPEEITKSIIGGGIIKKNWLNIFIINKDYWGRYYRTICESVILPCTPFMYMVISAVRGECY